MFIVQFGSFRSQNEQELPRIAIVHNREATGTNTAIGGEGKGEGLPRETLDRVLDFHDSSVP
jgi:hypothetical protein